MTRPGNWAGFFVSERVSIPVSFGAGPSETSETVSVHLRQSPVTFQIVAFGRRQPTSLKDLLLQRPIIRRRTRSDKTTVRHLDIHWDADHMGHDSLLPARLISSLPVKP